MASLGRLSIGCTAVLAVVVASVFASPSAMAQDRGAESTLDEENAAKVERLRAELTNQIQLQAYDLLDELVFAWTEAPPFDSLTPVILADVTVPVAFGSGLEALIETHMAQLLIKNANSNVQLSHCPACHALLVHSGESGTVISRGVDQPKALKKLRGEGGAEHALFIDFEAEGTALVLRARITRLSEDLPIVYARTLSSRTSSAPLLRKPDRLVSAEQARNDYEELLAGRGPLAIPVRLTLSAFAPNTDSALQVPIPIPWIQAGGELALGSARAWTASLIVGATFLPEIQTGLMLQGRIYRLISGNSFSLTRPNFYVFWGTALAVIQGPTAAVLDPEPSGNPIVDLLGTFATYPSVQTGIEFRLNNRIGASFFVESMPTLWTAENVGNWMDQLNTGIDFSFLQVNSLGVEVTFAF